MYKLLLCVRYLRTKYIALACIISVMLGVATMIVVNSVMAGFTFEMRDRLHNFLSDIVIESRSTEGISDAKRQMETVEQVAGQYIAAMTPTIDIPGMITFSDHYSGESYTLPVQIQGIDPESKALVGPFRDYLDSYNPVIEDGKVIRQPLRDPNEPLSWNLTSSAMEHRIAVKNRDALYLNNRMEDDLLPSAPLNSAKGSETNTEAPQTDSTATSNSEVPPPTFDSEATPPSEEAPGADDATKAAAPDMMSPASGDSSAVAAAEPKVGDSSAIDSTGISQDHFLAEEDTQPQAVKTNPLAARIYLGEGIVSFQAINPETGKAEKFRMVESGDDVILSTVTAGRPPEVTKFSATVVDSFRSGMNEYDTSIVLMNINELQKNRGMHLDNAITSIHIRLKNYDDAPKAIAALERAFPPGQVTIKTWEQKQGLLLSAVEVETAILNVLLFLIITVAGFGILAIFFMIVVEKTRDIGILKSLGASSSGVMSIFLSYGLALGIVGSTAGVIIGLLFVRYINEIEDGLSWLTGRKVFDEKIYYFFEIPTSVNPWMVISVAFGAISIAVLASILPARRAARLHPVRALRYE